MVKSINSYPIEVLKKSKAVLETNVKGVPGMTISVDVVSNCERQIREVEKAIQYLELLEKAKKKKRQGTLK